MSNTGELSADHHSVEKSNQIKSMLASWRTFLDCAMPAQAACMLDLIKAAYEENRLYTVKQMEKMDFAFMMETFGFNILDAKILAKELDNVVQTKNDDGTTTYTPGSAATGIGSSGTTVTPQ